MKMVGVLVTACVVLAAAQAVIAVLAMLALGGVVYGLFVSPKETLGLVCLMLIVGLLQAQPLAWVGIFAIAMVVKFFSK